MFVFLPIGYRDSARQLDTTATAQYSNNRPESYELRAIACPLSLRFYSRSIATRLL